MGEENRHIAPKLFQRLMAHYNDSDYIRAYQARFIFYFSLASTAVLLIMLLCSALVQIIDPTQKTLDLPMLVVEASGLVFFFIVLSLVARGRAILAAHLLISSALLITWVVMFLDRGTAVGRLDSILFVFAILSITPMMVQRRAALILVYTLVNIPVLFVFMFTQRDGLGIDSGAFFDYIGDVTVTLLFLTVTCYTVFAMNHHAQDRLRQDIRKREEAEAALKESKDRFHELFKMAPLPMAHISTDGRILDVNELLTRTMGYTLLTVPTLSHAWEQSMPDPEFRQRIISNWRKELARAMADNSEMAPFECQLQYLDRSVHTVVITTRLMSDSIIVGFYDITDRKIAETAREKLQEQLQQAQKMEAIGTLAGGIAHDFNNILSGIIGYTELVLLELEDRPSTQRNLRQVLSAGNRATDLVKQILTFSRSHKSEVKPIRPAYIVRDVIKLMRASLPSTIEITSSITSENYIMADATNIHQVLMNLSTNAAHAMKQKGGVLSVSLQDVTLGRDDLSHRPDALPGEYLRISVEDTGTGMSKEVQEKVFDPFFTTKELGEGTGMGLSTVHGIITTLGGFVSLYSEPGQGTSMHVFIPLIPGPSEIEGRSMGGPLKGGTERILFVDDERIQIDLAENALTRYGYQVTSFSDSPAALDHFLQAPDAYDLVITDMTMPKITGDMLTQKIRLKRPDIPVIMCTGFSEVMNEHKARELGIHAFLYKPVATKNMLEAIRKAIDSQR